MQVLVDGHVPSRLARALERDERLVAGRRVRRGEHRSVDLDAQLGRAQPSSQRLKTTHALWPPKPKELDTPISTCSSRASFGM